MSAGGVTLVGLAFALARRSDQAPIDQRRGTGMRSRTNRRVRRLALIMVAVPVAAWALEEAARRADARDANSPTGRRLRQGAGILRGFGRGPLANRLER
jgi:hypothetical protein